MFRRILISTLLLLALFVQSVPVQAQPVSGPAEATYTDWAQFISDVTVPDGTNFAANTAFTKIWRLKNIGNSTWTSSFSVVFISGEMMSSVSPQYLTTNVIPGQTVDISVNMVSPANPGTYQGFWALKNASGVLFGIGPSANSPFWVKITVGTGVPTGGIVYDFVTNAGSANWASQTTSLPYPGNPVDANGSVVLLSTPQLENGATVTTPGLETRPNNTSSGFIKGVYPDFYVQPTDRFKATLSCPYNAPGCNIFFQLDYQIGTGAVSTFASFREKSDGLYYNADVDLSLLAGKNVKFILTVANDGTYSTDDKGVWAAPRIERGSTTTTPPPSTGCTDKIAFIADVTVPDYTNMVPNYSFTKTWRLKNIGTCTWTPSYAVTYISGDPMSAMYPAPLTSNVAPGQSVDVSVNMVSPSVAGTYKGNWGLKNAVGTVFSLGTYSNIPFWVLINVNGGGPYPTPVPGACTNKAAFVSDVTVPDNSYVTANTAFTKIWRLKNSGTCTWTTAYSAVYVSGDPLSAVYPAPLPYTVYPGQSVDVAANMVAPSYTGTFKSNWSLKSDTGQVFALGSAANVPFFVLIQVIGGTGVTPTPVSSTPTPIATSTGITADLSVTVTNNKTTYTPGNPEVYTITVTNNGPYGVTSASFSYLPSAGQYTTASLSCVADAGAVCTLSGSLVSPNTYFDTPSLPSHTSVVYTATVSTHYAATGAFTNIASISVPAGVTDPNPSNNSATDTDVLAPVADLAVDITTGSTSYTPGTEVDYTITVTNPSGPSAINGALFGVSVNSNVGTWNVSCVGAGGATCTPTTPTDLSVGAGQAYFSGTVNIPPGGTATYTVKVIPNLAAVGSITVTASIAAPSGTTDPAPANNTKSLTLNTP
jgi:uncharacterized repeat protein (TIGR01451 family)